MCLNIKQQSYNVLIQEYKTYKETFVKKFELTKLPKYLIMCVKVCVICAQSNYFFAQKKEGKRRQAKGLYTMCD